LIVHPELLTQVRDYKWKQKHSLSSLSLFPESACSNVVLPDPGGPRSRVILRKHEIT